MKKVLMGVLGTALLAVLAAPALAQEAAKEKVWKSDGKRWFWAELTVKPAAEPAVMTVIVGPNEGGVLGFRYVGKNLERAFFRTVPMAQPAVAKGHTCTFRVGYVGKNLERRHYCVVDGAERPCPGMTKAGECLAVVK